MDTDKLIQAIDAAESASYGSDSDGDIEKDRETAIDLYLGKNIWPVPEGRSTVVDRSVYETIQWILPSLCRIFASGEDIVSLPPIGPEDEAGAKQEGEYLNWLVTQKNDWFNVFMEWAQDALLTKNAYCIACREEKVSFDIESYENQTPEGLALLLQDGDVEIIEHTEVPDETGQPQIDPMTGMQIPAVLHSVKLKRTQKDAQVRLYVLPPERVKVSKRTPTWKLADCDYFEWWENQSISELREQGFDIPDDVASDEEESTLEDEARDFYDERLESDDIDPSMRKVKARRIWIRHDADEDGIAERLYVLRIGKEIYYQDPCTRVPVACIVPNPLPHRHMGLSVADTVADLQAIKTAILRQGLDNLYLSNNPYRVVNGQVNLDDVMTSRPGAIVRVDGDINAAFRHETPPQIFPSIMQGLEYMDQVKENRTGTNRYFTGIDQNALNKTATGIQQLSSMAAQRVEQIARIFASGVEDLFSIVHELVLKGGHKKEVVKLKGSWVEVDPATWRKRTDFKISVGYAAGNKDAMVQRLLMIAQMQEKALAGGLPICTPNNVYETAIELTKASDFSQPERFWTDPAKVKQPPQTNPLAEAEQVKGQVQLQKTQLENQSKEAIEQLKARSDKYKADLDAQVKLLLAQQQSQDQHALKERELSHQTDMADSQADHAIYMEQKKSDLAPENREVRAQEESIVNEKKLLEIVEQMKQSNEQQTKTFLDALAQLGKAITAPRKIVRDSSGRVAGSEVHS